MQSDMRRHAFMLFPHAFRLRRPRGDRGEKHERLFANRIISSYLRLTKQTTLQVEEQGHI